jgi:drug/metabolite transporter (DMT)-like permease
MTPCSPLSFNRRFGGTYRLHLQALSILLATSLLAGLLNLFLRPRKWRQYVPPKRRLKLNGLHGIIFQNMILFITTAVKTSNPTNFMLLRSHNISGINSLLCKLWLLITTPISITEQSPSYENVLFQQEKIFHDLYGIRIVFAEFERFRSSCLPMR